MFLKIDSQNSKHLIENSLNNQSEGIAFTSNE